MRFCSGDLDALRAIGLVDVFGEFTAPWLDRGLVDTNHLGVPAQLVHRLSRMVHTADPVMRAIPAAGCRRSVLGVNLLSVSEH
jgi:hypothetical protein